MSKVRLKKSDKATCTANPVSLQASAVKDFQIRYDWIRTYSFSWVIILLGICYSIYLNSFITDEVFYSGDGGLKAILAKQLARGSIHFDLRLTAEPWVQDLWNQGLYPFHDPFIRTIGIRHYPIYPFTFPLSSAPFYALMGFRGLYVLPLLSLWLLWIGVFWTAYRLQLGDFLSTLILAALEFSSPLLLYSSMYWEHLPALALAWAGWMLIGFSPSLPLSVRRAVYAGIFLGLSTWFRPEYFGLVGAILILNFLPFGLKLEPQIRKAFWGGLTATILSYVFLNWILYGILLGPHSTLITHSFSFFARIQESIRFFFSLIPLLFSTVPLTWFFLLILPWIVSRKNNPLHQEMMVLTAGLLLFLLLVPGLLPSDGGKQWGPRFWLFAIPPILLASVWGLYRFISTNHKYIGAAALILFLWLFQQGIHQNLVVGTDILIRNYQKSSLPVLDFLKKRKEPVVVVSNQFIAMELEAVLDHKIFFRTSFPQDFNRLTEALVRQGYPEFLYMVFWGEPLPEGHEFTVENIAYKNQFAKPVVFGTFAVYPTVFQKNPIPIDVSPITSPPCEE